jgi:hypothetical protein
MLAATEGAKIAPAADGPTLARVERLAGSGYESKRGHKTGVNERRDRNDR